ncbi:MAG: efflux RND transporter periplasmic adaptor subunit [Fimbriimonas sp.]|nr:efflux RND transporter periplasmic adaptor subunit [Fimbriimonas sp.]
MTTDSSQRAAVPTQTPNSGVVSAAKRKKGPAKKVVTWSVTVVILGLLAFWGWGKLHAAPNLQMVTAKVARGDLVETVSATGSITAQTGAEVHVGSQIVGRIKRLTTDVGSYVKAGQLVAELDLPDLQDQLNQSEAALAQAQTRYAQQISGVNIVVTQTSSSLDVARQAVTSAQKKLLVADANATLQKQQTPSDIEKARTALSTTQSALAQTQADTDLEVNTAQEGVVQAQANATNSAISLVSAQSLFDQGFSAKTDLDTAKAVDGVNQSQVRAATHNLGLVSQKVTADLHAAKDSVHSAQAAFLAAKAETQTVLARNADVGDAEAAVKQANANLLAAVANGGNDTLKRQDVQTASEAVTQAQGLVAYSKAQMDKSFIRSPISGTVLQLSAQQGETVSAGLTTQTLLIVADLKRLEVDAFVDETDIGKIALGQSALCTVSAFPGRNFPGKITKIASGSTIQLAVVTYDVTVTIEDPQHQLKPDMTAKVTIETGHLRGALLVPAVAIQLGTRGTSVNVLQTVDGKPKIVSKPVKTGGTDGLNIEILSGLKEGDTIVLAGGTPTPTRTASSPFGSARGGPGGR